ncbi:hypothetical protein ACE6H2_014976 [Prunus campanulata]
MNERPRSSVYSRDVNNSSNLGFTPEEKNLSNTFFAFLAFLFLQQDGLVVGFNRKTQMKT